MNPVIKRLQDQHNQNFTVLDESSTNWTFSIDMVTNNFYTEIYSQHQIWELEYRILRQKIHTHLSKVEEQNPALLKEELASALVVAEILEHLYDFYLDVPREVTRFRKDQGDYRNMLLSMNVSFPGQIKVVAHPHVSSKSSTLKVRETTSNLNWYRLLFVRSIRALNMIEFISSHTGPFTNFMMALNIAVGPILPYIAFIYFLPRLFTNLGVLLKHTIPGSWMSEEEKGLAWTTRLWTQIKRRYFELGNDIAWAGVGTVNCFVLVGMLAPFAVYVSVAFFTYDVLLAVFRAYVELSRLRKLHEDYDLMLQAPDIDPNLVNEITALQAEINRRIEFDKVRLGINVLSTITIALAVACAIPIFLACPAIPLAGALWLVAICFITYLINRVLTSYEPKTSVEFKVDQAPMPQDKPATLRASSHGKNGFFRSVSKTNLLVNSESDETMQIDRAYSTLAINSGA